MQRNLNVLIVEDSPDDAELLLHELRRGGYEPTFQRVETAETMTIAMQQETWEIVISDYSLPQFSAPAAWRLVQQRRLDLPFLIVSGMISDELGVTCMKAGVHDYLSKDNLTRLVPTVKRELDATEHRRRRRLLEQEIQASNKEMRIAQAVQQRLFPTAAPCLPGFDIAGAAYAASSASGDYFDFIPLFDGCLGIAIGDASGHGAGPALMMAETRTCLRTLALASHNIQDMVSITNKVLYEGMLEGRFVTLFFAHLDSQTRTLSYVGAGHRAHLLDASGRLSRVLNSTALPLGVKPDFNFPAGPSLLLEPGELLLLTTDGIEEARAPDGTLFGAQRTFEVVREFRHLTAADIVQNLYHAVRAFTHNRPQHDDITAVVVKVDDVA